MRWFGGRIVFQSLEIHYALGLGRANPLPGTLVALYPSSGWHLSGTSAYQLLNCIHILSNDGRRNATVWIPEYFHAADSDTCA